MDTGWTILIPGQPPSVNHMYVRVRGRWDRMAKAPGVEQYQNDIVLLCRAAKPSGWTHDGQIRITFQFALGRDADCDNLLKVIQDAVAIAIGVNDRVFLPCVISKTTGNKQPYTVVGVQSLSLLQALPGS